MRDARRRADDIARAAGLKITSVYAVSPVPFGTLNEEFLGRSGSDDFSRGGSVRYRTGEISTALPKVVLRGSVNVIFNVSSGPK